MLGLAEHLPRGVASRFLSFREGGRCEPFLMEARRRGFTAEVLEHDTPRLGKAARALASRLTTADMLLCHGYKANLVGRIAARRAGIPAVAVSRGWTGESRKVRLYEAIDRWHLRFMDHVIAVSEGQAAKVRAAGVPDSRISIIRNAARLQAFQTPDPDARQWLESQLPGRPLVLAAGRLSPEKGFHVLVEAAARVPQAGFILFGEGRERPRLERMIGERGLAGRFLLPGHTDRLDRYLPWASLVVLPSFTEGLPNVALEASAAGVAVVATAVGGTPEVVANGETGLLVPPGEPEALADALRQLLENVELRARYAAAGRERMQRFFTFESQAAAYMSLLNRLRPAARLAA